MQKEKMRIRISDTKENGDGFARVEGMAVFVPGLVTGDIAEICVEEIRKNYAVGRCVELIEPSEHRIQPECPSYGKCGGCTLGHVNDKFENVVKQNCVRAALRRMKLPYERTEETRYPSTRTGYRNKIGLHYDKNTRSFGYYARASHEIFPFTGCKLCSESMNRIVAFLNEHSDLAAALSPTDLFLRSSCDGRMTVSIDTDARAADITPCRTALMKHFPEVQNVLLLDGTENSTEHYVTEEYMGITMRISSESFRQVNHAAAEILMEMVCAAAAEEPFSYAADLYCGSGAFGLALAKKFPHARFFGLEIDREAIRAATANAERNGLTNIEFVCADAASFNGQIPAGDGTFYPPELVIVDPPRAGLSEKMREGLGKLCPHRLVYVSCNPQTMARDLAELVQCGYSLDRVTPVNMFPMTKHVETVVLLIHQKSTEYFKVDYAPEDGSYMDNLPASATYTEIKQWISDNYDDMKVSSLYIAQVKQKHGIIERECYNKPKSQDAKQPQCPPEKAAAIEAALKHFKMI